MATNPTSSILFSEPYGHRVFQGYRTYVSNRFGSQIFDDVCKIDLGLDPASVVAENRWFSEDVHSRFFHFLQMRTGEINLAEKVGRIFESPEIWGLEEFSEIASRSPRSFFQSLPNYFSKFIKAPSPKAMLIRSGLGVLQISPPESGRFGPHVCRRANDIFLGAKTFLSVQEFKVVHNKCIHRGDELCEFTLSWLATGFWREFASSCALFRLNFQRRPRLVSLYYERIRKISQALWEERFNALSKQLAHDIRSPLSALDVGFAHGAVHDGALISLAIKRMKEIASSLSR